MTNTVQQVSVSPLTGMSYQLPRSESDKEGIDSFISKHPDKPVVVIQGLGFVGAVMSLVCANSIQEDYAVLGVDIAAVDTYWKIASINEGTFPVVASDPKISQFYQQARAKGNLYATFDPYAYSIADVIIVDVNLDVEKQTDTGGDLKGYSVELGPFESAIEAIGKHCRDDVLVLVETTVPPGTCERLVRPTLERCLSTRDLSTERLRIGHSYERVMPGPDYIDSIQSFYRVYSGVDDASADATEAFLRTIIRTDEYPLTRLGSTNASEMAKVLENSYRAMNIAFVVEWSRFAEEAGVDLYEVVSTIRLRPTHSNLMYPGLGVGGYCLTKDPLLASWARRDVDPNAPGLQLSEAGVIINDKMPRNAFEFLKREYEDRLAGRRVLLLGVSYRSDIGDTRYSPVGLLYDLLLEDGCTVDLHDPHVSFWEEKNIEIGKDYDTLFEQEPRIVIICTTHSEYKKNEGLIRRIRNLEEAFVLDTVGVLTNEEIDLLSTQHKVRVVGRGDIP